MMKAHSRARSCSVLRRSGHGKLDPAAIGAGFQRRKRHPLARRGPRSDRRRQENGLMAAMAVASDGEAAGGPRARRCVCWGFVGESGSVVELDVEAPVAAVAAGWRDTAFVCGASERLRLRTGPHARTACPPPPCCAQARGWRCVDLARRRWRFACPAALSCARAAAETCSCWREVRMCVCGRGERAAAATATPLSRRRSGLPRRRKRRPRARVRPRRAHAGRERRRPRGRERRAAVHRGARRRCGAARAGPARAGACGGVRNEAQRVLHGCVPAACARAVGRRGARTSTPAYIHT